ncbi:MAG TPA: FAD-dependent oxidoreductase [Thermoanaerobaculia bacterium]|nr:FAD-dependent oxidoreductase [Thermoanaerobaculia bacterium]
MPPAASPPDRLLLVGAGHAHLEILRRLGEEPRFTATVVTLDERHYYSGMVPGYLAGTYSAEEISFDVPALADRAGVTFLLGRAVRIDADARHVDLEDGTRLPFDLASCDTGSLTAGASSPGVEEHAVQVKPFHRAGDLRRRLLELASRRDAGTRQVVMVGGGAAGVEVAFAVASLLDAAGGDRSVTVLERGPHILSGYSERFRRRARRALAERRIALRTRSTVAEVTAASVRLADEDSLPSDLTIWLTGPTASPLYADSGLPTDSRGFMLVDPALRCLAAPHLLGAGDCVTLADHPETPKAGVYAVRQAPVLWQSLLAARDGSPPPAYTPQASFLSLLNTADGRALLRYKALVAHARWAFRLKDRIDRGFMRKYQEA